MSANPSLTIGQLTITAGKRTLLEDANAHINPGQITLIVGPSGVGKSVLLKVIAGLIPADHATIRYQGTIRIDDHGVQFGDLGVVFQSFALFDELSPTSNVAFAQAHRRERDGQLPAPSNLLEELRVPLDVRTSQLSGGQRQRLAIARTLAYDPEFILYDEPTSGLDPATGKQVAELIRDTSRQHCKTSLVVTHDYESLLPIADHLFFFDAETLKLVEVPRDRWQSLASRIDKTSATAVSGVEQTSQTVPLGDRVTQFLIQTSRFVELTLIGLLSLIPWWRSPRWGLRYFAHYLRLMAGPSAWFYLGVAGAIVGFVTTFFVFKHLPFRNYTQPLLITDLLSAMGFTLYRVFVPVMSTVLIAARCGAAMAADIGSKQYGNQIDALNTVGASPRAYLFSPVMIVFAIGTPLLTLWSFWVSRVVSMLAFTYMHPHLGADIWNLHFHRVLTKSGGWAFDGTEWLIPKLICCGLGIGVIAYYRAIQPKYSSADVSKSVTTTIFWATLFVLVVHFLFAFLEF